MDDTWTNVLAEIQKILPSQSFSTWVAPIRPLNLKDGNLTLQVPNKFFADWLDDHEYSAIILDIAQTRLGQRLQIQYVVEPPPNVHMRTTMASRPQIPEKDYMAKAKRIGLNQKYTFDTFVVGSSNQFAHAASLAVAEKSPRTYNPLFIYGGVGLGKTHLLNAIGNFKLFTYPDMRVSYVHSESFMNELIQALGAKRMPEFRDKYRKMDILLMDDIQFLAGKERTQEEFFHTFNSLYETHKNIVVTSDKFPKEIPGLEDRLRSRFEWGLIADIQPPDMETKVAILQKKAEIESIRLPSDVALFLASHFTSNVRELEGSLVRISAFSSLTHSNITIDLAKNVLKDFIHESSHDVTFDKILKAVAHHYNVSVQELKGNRRTKRIALPRQIVMYLTRDMTESSFPEIGQKLGGRDHTTVIYAHKKISEAITTDKEVAADIRIIRSALR